MTDIQQLVRDAWPEWELTDEIGQGAFARVYRACGKDGREAAVKVLMIPDDWEDTDTLRCEGYSEEKIAAYYQQRVQTVTKEITIMQKLQDSPHIVRIEDHCVLHPEPLRWIILIRMELLTPLTKRAALKEMDSLELARVGSEMCSALAQCHRRGIVHRDIKPENIFVDQEGNYKLGDFGAANELEKTRTLSWKGTPSFMAPEIYRAETGGHGLQHAKLADIYSLGLVLYWLGNGLTLPFVRAGKQIASPQERTSAFQRRINGERLPALDRVKSPLAAVILHACAYAPEERWQSAEEMGEALKEAMDAGSGPAGKKKGRTFLLCCAVLLVLCGAAFAWQRISAKKAHPNTPAAQPSPAAVTDTGVRFPQKDPLHIYVYFPEETWFSDAQPALWEAMRITPCNEDWIAENTDETLSQFGGSTEAYFAHIRCEAMGLWDVSVNPWDPEEWPLADAVLFFPMKSVDYSPLVEELHSAGIPAYIFSSDDPESVRQEYLSLFGISNQY
ncbi:MAG: serine/threonine protein kinase [Clostridia bacterium]|nr:serine/threonine protein kinase [Clostridia bacterium]